MKQRKKSLAELDGDIDVLLESIVRDQHPEFGGGALSPSAYDTAWVAMVRDPRDPNELAFPHCFEGLFDLQEADGSFGTPYPQTIVPTLAALLCLKKAPHPDARTKHAAERARTYLECVFPNWDVTQHETAAFEILVPRLLGDLAEMGIEFTFPMKSQLLAYSEKKLALLRPEWFYEKHSTLAHAMEAMGGRVDFNRVHVQQAENGSYGGSPSSTAAVLIHGSWDERAAQWIEYIYKRERRNGKSFMPIALGIDVFELCWVLHYVHEAGYDLTHASAARRNVAFVQWLECGLKPHGVGGCAIERTLPIDGDDTSLALACLRLLGKNPPLEPLLHFETSTHFLCYEGERVASTSTNAHVLHALLHLPPPKRQEMLPRIEKVTTFLVENARPEGYWADKWHASPLYATSCAVQALAASQDRSANEALEKALHWTLEAQFQDGGWGMLLDRTAEETAYALMTLFALQGRIPQAQESHVQSALQRGMTYLRRHADPPGKGLARRPSLWISKELYAPYRVIEAAILATLRRGIDVPSTTTNPEV